MSDVNKRAQKGIRLLLVRQGALQVFTLIGSIILARVLDQADFGVFGITTFLVKVLAMFADFGMTPALIQRKQSITNRDLQVGFTMKQGLVTLVVISVWLLAPWMASFYPKAPDVLEWLVRAMAFNLFLTSWRSVSALQLERKLRYEKLAVIEVVESMSYQIVAVTMAVMGYGVWSLIAAVLVQGVLGTVLVYAIAPWRIGFAYDREIALEMLRFGIPFQMHQLIGNVRSWVTPTLVAALIGADAVGYLMWASSTGRKPRAIVKNVVRVSLPHFSRLQDEPEKVKNILAQYVAYFMVFCGLWFALLTASGSALVEFVYTAKWLPALPALMLYSMLFNLNAISWITKTALSSTGRVKFVMYVTMLASAISVGLGIFLVLRYGFIGVPLAEVVSMSITVPILVMKVGGVKALRSILGASAWVLVPIAAAIAAGFGVRQLDLPLWLLAFGSLATAGLVFTGVSWFVSPRWLRNSATQKVQALIQKVRKRVADEPVEA